MTVNGALVAKVVSDDQLCEFVTANGGADRAVTWMASRQLSVVTRSQLRLAGLTDAAIARRCAAGLLHRVYRGVFLWGSTAALPAAVELAAQLACGPDACVSHRSAAWLWGLVQTRDPATVEVTLIGHGRRSRDGLRVHRVPHLADDDRATRRGIPVTAPERTVIDLAASASSDELEHALTEAYAQRLITESRLEAALVRARNRPGVAAVRAQLRAGPGLAVLRSRSERLLRRLLRQARLAQPVTNVKREGYEVDALWPEHKLVVEFDGYATHGHRVAFERDRRRDAVLVAAGYRVIRVTWRQLTQEPLMVVANIARALTQTT
jgi:very-short-patch-repair endonuclease